MKSVLSQPFGTLDVFDKMEVIAFYLAIVLAVCIAVFAVILKKKRPEKLGAFLNGAKHFIFGCALSFAVTMLTLKISESVEAGEMPAKVFWPIFSIRGGSSGSRLYNFGRETRIQIEIQVYSRGNYGRSRNRIHRNACAAL